jgi:hypothetical protein
MRTALYVGIRPRFYRRHPGSILCITAYKTVRSLSDTVVFSTALVFTEKLFEKVFLPTSSLKSSFWPFLFSILNVWTFLAGRKRLSIILLHFRLQ